MAEKVRLRRKDIKRPDEFITLTSQAVAWAKEHQQLVTWGGVAAIAIIVAIGIAAAYRGARERDANADLARAMQTLGANDYAAAASALLDVSSRWDGTGVAPVAGLLGANAALRGGDPDKAMAELTRLQAQSSDWPSYLRQQLLVAWGLALEDKQQWQDAAAKYKDAAALDGPYTSDAMLGEARARERAGEADRAKALYQQVYEQFPDLPSRDLVAAKL